jgi:cell division protein FtsL
MKKSYVALMFFFVFTMSGFLGLVAWQSIRFTTLENEVKALEAQQEEWVNSNKRLIAAIAFYSSAEKIEQKAIKMGLIKIPPEDVLQIRLNGDAKP